MELEYTTTISCSHSASIRHTLWGEKAFRLNEEAVEEKNEQAEEGEEEDRVTKMELEEDTSCHGVLCREELLLWRNPLCALSSLSSLISRSSSPARPPPQQIIYPLLFFSLYIS
ncbi:hypothetical protein B9Z55_000762 [Caenorhabditis nigoni]|uniref:Uncharacterized protein n=1 Tax=Caenorhabditis nigoni TaxID=1611254 RepID=A0A2G5VUP7_9PELO|nr:hypothetical protein B9Z55_000762 [Caenorhabditis nigoni]